MIKFQCNKCSFAKDVSDKYLNKRVRCPKCQAPNLVSQKAEAKAQPTQKTAPPADVIRFACPSCSLKIKVKSEYAGKKVRCAKCKNPLTVPAAPKAAPSLEVKDPTSVLRAGHEDTGKNDFGGDIFSGMDDLLGMEQNSQAVARPERDMVSAVEDEASEELQRAQKLARAGKGKGDSGKSGGSKFSGKNIFCLSVIAAGCMMFISLAVLVSFAYQAKNSGIGDYPRINAFAMQYIDLSVNGDAEASKELLSAKLQDEVTAKQLNEMTELLRQSGTLNLKKQRQYLYKKTETKQDFFGLRFDGLTSSGKISFLFYIMEVDDKLKIEAITSEDTYGEKLILGKSHLTKMLDAGDIQRLKLNATFVGSARFFLILFFTLFALFGLLTLVSICIVYKKAGQPVWAVFVPVYSQWVLAEIGEKPGWWGLIVAFSGFIPFGGIVSIILMLLISIGIAQTFDRGILFGLGLLFLPFIFYPILAFTGDKFEGMY